MVTKDKWIQKAKALLFDLKFNISSPGLYDEVEELIKEGGGYNCLEESADTELRWPNS